MTQRDLTLEQIRQMAAEADFERFSEAHLQQLMRATNASRARRKKLGIERLVYADEPAHVFRLTDEVSQ